MKRIIFAFGVPAIFMIFSCDNNRYKEPGFVRNDSVEDPQHFVNKTGEGETLSGSATMAVDTSCVDLAKKDTAAICVEVYEPVCGCDGKTYSNSCKAESNGIKKYTKGECKK